ncbi:MAG: hypothetical protein LBN27_11705 [Prevotellaceae bacterium]|jgi:hypothetical protein|nr:hypothetical protein [Prevotellaceae bacterium]GHT35109.1 hypothetical protein FACS189434_12410 [Bacteroidia bacterium]
METKTLKDDLKKTLFKRANVRESDIYKAALAGWIDRHLDLLTPVELNQYKPVILQ